MARCLVALGSNLGDRRATLLAALAQLGRFEGTRVLAHSQLHETPPERPGDGGPFLNAAALLETALIPTQLLAELLRLERRHGRQRQGSRGPRTLDLDLILYGQLRVKSPHLHIPHPRFHKRGFVLLPACEVAASLVDPRTGFSIRRLARRWKRAAAEAQKKTRPQKRPKPRAP